MGDSINRSVKLICISRPDHLLGTTDLDDCDCSTG